MATISPPEKEIANKLFDAGSLLYRAAEHFCDKKDVSAVAFCVNEAAALERRARHIEARLKGR